MLMEDAHRSRVEEAARLVMLMEDTLCLHEDMGQLREDMQRLREDVERDIGRLRGNVSRGL